MWTGEREKKFASQISEEFFEIFSVRKRKQESIRARRAKQLIENQLSTWHFHVIADRKSKYYQTTKKQTNWCAGDTVKLYTFEY